MPATNGAGRLPAFDTLGELAEFLSAIVNSMQNWNDNTQAALPGYRDRIVTVFLDRDEGGLNLDMPPEILRRLRARGAAAGALIASRFAAPSTIGPTAMNWENHRWLRFRSAIQALRDYLAHYRTAATLPQPPDVTYDQLIQSSIGLPTKSYPLPTADREAVAEASAKLAALGQSLDAILRIEYRMPKPPARLGVKPSLKT